ncbi:MAG: endolytic transglycosylase MltG [Kiloniellales bacterium]
MAPLGRWLLRGALALAFLGALGVAALLYLEREYEARGPLASETTVIVPPGASLSAIATTLKDAGVIAEPTLFRLAVRIFGAPEALRAGEYAFAAGISAKEVARLLESGRTVVHRLTVPEGLTSAEIVALMAGAEALAGTLEKVPPEGSLLPETYHFSRGDRRAEIVERMTRAHEAALAELWPKRAGGLPLATPEEAVILASIVEKETGVASERPLVASVFVNRLKRGMRLQSDPTVIYALTGGKGPLARALTRGDLATVSPYNSYLVPGLPPGPIGNPGRAALEAVLNPAESAYLYFVADGTGGHAFAETLEEHNRNVAKWRKIRRTGKAASGN